MKVQDLNIKNIPIRVYSPKEVIDNNNNKITKYPCLIYCHGGAFFTGNIDIYDYYLNTIAINLNIVVISIGYRLTPEHCYPTAIQDCWTIVQHYLENSHLYKADLRRTILCGDSAGGNIVAVISQRIIEHKIENFPKLCIYITPFLQLYNLELPSQKRYFPRGILSYMSFYTGKLVFWYLGITNSTREMNRIFIRNLHTLALDDEELRTKYKKLISTDLIEDKYKKDYYETYKTTYPERKEEPNLLKTDFKLKELIKTIFIKEISASLMDESLIKKMPNKAYFIIYECDQLKDDGLIFAKRLELAGIDVKVI